MAWSKRGIPLISSIVALTIFPAQGRDLDGRFRSSPLHEWFEQLASHKGLCCSYADGHAVEDVDWEAKDGHYRVRLPKDVGSKDMIWVDVPDDAVITEPNRAGRTMVWPIYNDFYRDISIRCFMPGSMT
ncbi:hypothetical protein [Bradyrhizobium liaoningense]|uniref:hypothetical protein n=1 Tax=Bradyrhizobium liaoningense TaxID=43992 RepID=UPI00289D1E80|nr:hypothetical protein [Bradyrhizobium liaoningense]